MKKSSTRLPIMDITITEKSSRRSPTVEITKQKTKTNRSPQVRVKSTRTPSNEPARYRRSKNHRSPESISAEMSANKLVTELKTKGYDPRTGGDLLLKESASEDMDQDRYKLTPEEEERFDGVEPEMEDDDDDTYPRRDGYETRDDYTQDFTEDETTRRSYGYSAASATTGSGTYESRLFEKNIRTYQNAHVLERKRPKTPSSASTYSDDRSWESVEGGFLCFRGACGG